ncbi:CHAP domain-containing protein [Planomonospora corallina]|uniref:CHAP domain-containing protein n=1 Tax=Planomonospora corallina TaxID=1806052 RepID=A0ABV8I1D1_9ACTN
MSALSRVFRGSLTAGLALTAVTGFSVLSAAPAAADTLSDSSPFADLQARIAEIESNIATLRQGTVRIPAATELPARTAPGGLTEQTGTGGLQAGAGTRSADVQDRLDQARAQLESAGIQLPGRLGATGSQAQAAPLSAAAKAQQVVATALSKVGEGESGDGTTAYGIWYDEHTKQKGFAAAAWCDMFLAWVGVQNGVDEQMGVFAYTPWHAEWFDKQRRFDRTPRVGDLVFFDWAGSRSIAAIDHVGLVTGVNPDGSVTTVEGNISDKVVTRTRTMQNIVGFGHPAYGG